MVNKLNLIFMKDRDKLTLAYIEKKKCIRS